MALETNMDDQKYSPKSCSFSPRLGHVGDVIRAARKYRRLSQCRLADLCDLSPKMISLVECGKRNISWGAFQRVLKELRFSVTFYPIEIQPMPEELVPILNEAIPNLQELLVLLEKIRKASRERAKETNSRTITLYNKEPTK